MSPLISALLMALAAGQVTSFSDVPESDRDALRVEFSGSFDDEQRTLLKNLVFVVDGREAEVDAFNESSPLNQLGICELADGAKVLPVSVITDTSEGRRFAGAYGLLLTLPVRQITDADWPIPDE